MLSSRAVRFSAGVSRAGAGIGPTVSGGSGPGGRTCRPAGRSDSQHGHEHALPQRRLVGDGRDRGERKDMEQRTGGAEPPPGDDQRTAAGHQGGGHDLEPDGRRGREPEGAPGAGGQGGQQHHHQHQRPGADLEAEAPGVRLVAAVDPGEGAEGGEDRQVQAVQQHQRDQRDKDADGAAEGDLVVLVAGSHGEHLGEHLHRWVAPFFRSELLRRRRWHPGPNFTPGSGAAAASPSIQWNRPGPGARPEK